MFCNLPLVLTVQVPFMFLGRTVFPKLKLFLIMGKHTSRRKKKKMPAIERGEKEKYSVFKIGIFYKLIFLWIISERWKINFKEYSLQRSLKLNQKWTSTNSNQYSSLLNYSIRNYIQHLTFNLLILRFLLQKWNSTICI